MIILDGKEVARQCNLKLKTRVQKFVDQRGRQPGLAVILVGDDPASQVYVRNKLKSCEENGLRSFQHFLSGGIEPRKLEDTILALNEDSSVDGILLQLPLPKHLDREKFVHMISPLKDADGLGYESMGRLMAGKPRVISCTPKGVMTILKHYKLDVSGKNAVVIGRSEIVGKPMSQLLLNENATVTTAHSKTQDIKSHTLAADIVVVAAGRARLFGKEHFKKGSVIIDVGMHRQDIGGGKTKLCGDVRYEELEGHCAAATPVPGGVGPMTIAMLMENTLDLAELH